MNLTLKVWRQTGPNDSGRFETYQATDVKDEMSFLEMLDVVNENLIADGHDDLNPITQLLAQLLVPRHREPESSLRDAPERPILIAHARDDDIVRVHHAQRLQNAAPHATLIIDEDGSHARISEPTLEQIIAFIRTHTNP